MSEIRYDPIHDFRVIIAEERLARPDEYMAAGNVAQRSDRIVPPDDFPLLSGHSAALRSRLTKEEACPFCEGRETQTPSERDAVAQTDRQQNSPGWQVRSVPNRYPSISPHGDQEVIIDTPRHLERFGDMTDDECRHLIRFWHRRLHHLREENRWQYAQLFKNQGSAAGASMRHLHTQIFCLPYVPREVLTEAQGLAKHLENTGTCYHCDTLADELRDRLRFLGETPHLAAFCPFASRFQGEIHILPKRHIPCFTQTTPEELDDLSRFLPTIIRRLERILPTPAYNLVLRQSPWPVSPHFHWRLEILPRLNGIAGFEWGTGDFINPCSPERFAAQMR